MATHHQHNYRMHVMWNFVILSHCVHVHTYIADWNWYDAQTEDPVQTAPPPIASLGPCVCGSQPARYHYRAVLLQHCAVLLHNFWPNKEESTIIDRAGKWHGKSYTWNKLQNRHYSKHKDIGSNVEISMNEATVNILRAWYIHSTTVMWMHTLLINASDTTHTIASLL